MNAEQELIDKILKITTLINDKYPELSDFLSEMPDTLGGKKNSDVNVKQLREYYNSLNQVLQKYTSHTHEAEQE